jgi:hypothetical protein
MSFLVNIFLLLLDLCMTVYTGQHGILKDVMIILEISDRTVSSIKLRITFAYMRYAFNYRHVGK